MNIFFKSGTLIIFLMLTLTISCNKDCSYGKLKIKNNDLYSYTLYIDRVVKDTISWLRSENYELPIIGSYECKVEAYSSFPELILGMKNWFISMVAKRQNGPSLIKIKLQ